MTTQRDSNTAHTHTQQHLSQQNTQTALHAIHRPTTNIFHSRQTPQDIKIVTRLRNLHANSTFIQLFSLYSSKECS